MATSWITCIIVTLGLAGGALTRLNRVGSNLGLIGMYVTAMLSCTLWVWISKRPGSDLPRLSALYDALYMMGYWTILIVLGEPVTMKHAAGFMMVLGGAALLG